MLLHGLDQYGNVKTLSTDWGVEAGIASFMNHYRTAACFRKFAAALAGSNDGDIFYQVEDIDFSNAGGFIHMVSRDGEAATKSFGKKEVLVEAWCGRIRANDSRLSHVNALPFGSEKKINFKYGYSGDYAVAIGEDRSSILLADFLSAHGNFAGGESLLKQISDLADSVFNVVVNNYYHVEIGDGRLHLSVDGKFRDRCLVSSCFYEKKAVLDAIAEWLEHLKRLRTQ